MENLAGILAEEQKTLAVGTARGVYGGACVVELAGETIRAAFQPGQEPKPGELVWVTRTRSGNVVAGVGGRRARDSRVLHIKD